MVNAVYSYYKIMATLPVLFPQSCFILCVIVCNSEYPIPRLLLPKVTTSTFFNMWIFVSFLVYLLICSIDATCKWSHTLFAFLLVHSAQCPPSPSMLLQMAKKKKKVWFVCLQCNYSNLWVTHSGMWDLTTSPLHPSHLSPWSVEFVFSCSFFFFLVGSSLSLLAILQMFVILMWPCEKVSRGSFYSSVLSNLSQISEF